MSGPESRLYERSLFERFQSAGRSIFMLDVQYRFVARHSAHAQSPHIYFADMLVDPFVTLVVQYLLSVMREFVLMFLKW